MSSFLCRLVAATVTVFTLVCLIFLITWLVLKPRFPDFRVVSGSVTSLNATGPELTAKWDIALVVRNPNHKLSISYDSLDAEVWYGEDRVGVRVLVLDSTRLPPFFQGTQSQTSLRVQFAVVNEYLDNGVPKAIAAERARGSVRFGFTFLAWVRFKSGMVLSRDHFLKVDCDPVRFMFSPNNGTGTLVRSLFCE